MFKGKVAIVTGGARGIGRTYATALLDKGVKVCICDVNETAAEEFIGSLTDSLKNSVFFQKCDVTNFDDFKAAFDKTLEVFGQIDIFVNNAGVADEHNWKKTVDVNLVGTIQGVKLAFQYMGIENGGKGGSIVNISSIAGLSPTPSNPVYSATKYGVIGLTKSYGDDYHFKRNGIKVHAICPGCVNTYMFQHFSVNSVDKEEADKFLNSYALTPIEDLGKGLIQILEDGKNGSILVVDENGAHYEE